MTRLSVVHDTIIVVVERHYPFAPKRMFAAWTDPAQRARWHFPSDANWVLAEFAQDFKIGGHEHARFGPPSR